MLDRGGDDEKDAVLEVGDYPGSEEDINGSEETSIPLQEDKPHDVSLSKPKEKADDESIAILPGAGVGVVNATPPRSASPVSITTMAAPCIGAATVVEPMGEVGVVEGPARTRRSTRAKCGTPQHHDVSPVRACSAVRSTRRRAGTQVREESGTQVREESGTQVREDSGTQVREDSGTQVRGETGTQVREESGTQVKEETGTQVREESGTQVREETGTCEVEEVTRTVESKQKTDGDHHTEEDMGVEAEVGDQHFMGVAT